MPVILSEAKDLSDIKILRRCAPQNDTGGSTPQNDKRTPRSRGSFGYSEVSDGSSFFTKPSSWDMQSSRVV